MLRRMFCARVSFFTILPCLACAYANGMNLWRAVCNKCVIQKFFFVISTRIALLLVFVGTQFVSFHSNFQLFQFPVDLASRKQVSWFIVLSLDRQTFAMYLADADIPTATPNNNGMTQKKTTNCKLIDTYQSGPLISTYAHIVAFIRQPWVVVNFKRFIAFANFWEKIRQKYSVKLGTEISKIQSFFWAQCVCAFTLIKSLGNHFSERTAYVTCIGCKAAKNRNLKNSNIRCPFSRETMTASRINKSTCSMWIYGCKISPET